MPPIYSIYHNMYIPKKKNPNKKIHQNKSLKKATIYFHCNE